MSAGAVDSITIIVKENMETVSLFCESCNKEVGVDRGTRRTCDKCESSILSKLSLTRKVIPVRTREEYNLSRKEMMELRVDKIMSLKLYTYMAFRMDYLGEDSPKVDLKKFCNRWQVTQEDVLQSIAGLARKGFMKIQIRDLTAKVLSHDDRVAELEDILNGVKADR
jgi:hypothetical protein